MTYKTVEEMLDNMLTSEKKLFKLGYIIAKPIYSEESGDILGFEKYYVE